LQTKLISYFPKEFDAQKLLEDVNQSFYLPEYQKEVKLGIDPYFMGSVTINSDYDKLRQIFTNLVSNAFKYTQSGTITIGLTAQKDQWVFFVKDTGLGIPPAEHEKVFERFYRASNVNKLTIGGTGLGLSIVYELIVLLGGNIWVESETGMGSTFFFAVPITSA
jgi:signal transduction histidine kinase